MIRIITKANIVTNAHYVAGFAALRHRVFVERLGWNLASATQSKGFEYDRFDNADAVYMVICNADDEVVAGLRLLKTTASFLMEECFPELAHGAIPNSDSVWEVSRFVVDPCPVRTAGCHALGTQLVWALQSYGLLHGLTGFVSASYAGMERLLRSHGCRFSRLGSPRTCDGRKIVPLSFEISEDILASVEGRLLEQSRPGNEAAPLQAVIAGFAAQGLRLSAMVA